MGELIQGPRRRMFTVPIPQPTEPAEPEWFDDFDNVILLVQYLEYQMAIPELYGPASSVLMDRDKFTDEFEAALRWYRDGFVDGAA